MKRGPLAIHKELTARLQFFEPEAFISQTTTGRFVLCKEGQLDDHTTAVVGMFLASSEDEAHEKLREHYHYHE